MSSRFKSLGFGSSKRRSQANVPTLQNEQQQPTVSPQQLGRPEAPSASASTNSLPMNHPGGIGRPPSYTSNSSPGGPNVQNHRSQSPMSPPPGQGPRTPPTQMHNGPPPITTTPSGGYPPQHGGYGPPLGQQMPLAGPPQYGSAAPYPVGGQGGLAPMPYAGNRNSAHEVEGAGRSKAQLIVGIDFVSDYRMRFPRSYH